MAQVIDGKALAKKIRENLKVECNKLKEKGIVPKLAVIMVGDNPASKVYVRNKSKACEEVGIEYQEFLLKDRVRIELADALVQGVRNGRISGNSNAFVDFAKQKLASEDDFVTSRAILILGGDHSGNNLELILRELKKEKEGTYRAAVLALSQQCDIDAIDVENFVEALKKEEVRAFFHKTWQGLDSHRSLMCGRK